MFFFLYSKYLSLVVEDDEKEENEACATGDDGLVIVYLLFSLRDAGVVHSIAGFRNGGVLLLGV